MVFYAVTRGRETGVFKTWEKVAPLVNGYRNARFRKFSDSQTAQTEYEKNESHLLKFLSSTTLSPWSSPGVASCPTRLLIIYFAVGAPSWQM